MKLLAGDGHPRDLINPASRAFRALDLALDQISDERAIDLMMSDNSILRRPILLMGDRRIMGFDAEEYRKLES